MELIFRLIFCLKTASSPKHSADNLSCRFECIIICISLVGNLPVRHSAFQVFIPEPNNLRRKSIHRPGFDSNREGYRAMNDYASVFSDFRPVNRLDILEVRTVYNEEQICSRPLVLFITGFDRLSGSLHLAFIPAILRNLALSCSICSWRY